MDNLELINQGYEGRDGICLSFSLSFSCFSFPFKHQLFSQVLREPFLVDRHEPGEVVEEENALSISRVKRLCFYTNPTSSPHSAAAVLFLCLQYVSGGCPAAPRTRLNAK